MAVVGSILLERLQNLKTIISNKIPPGIFVKEQHLPAVQASPDLELKALYSRSLTSAKSVASSLSDENLYSDDSKQSLSDLLARDDIRAVIIALPIPAQPAYIKQALTAGKHVLAEKPVAKDVATARELIQWYGDKNNVDKTKATLAIAEQFRYFNSFQLGAQRVRELGSVLNFRVRMQTCIQQGSKYIETPWRKTPEYQGGFLLDGGVHFIAGLRCLLGSEAKAASLSAFTAQHQSYLPPVDSADAVLKLKNGGQGTFSLSFGTTATGNEWAVACEGGEVIVEPFEGKVTVKAKGETEGKTEEAKDEFGGVKQEVFAWAKSIKEGKPDPKQSPEEALGDLEMLEAILKSGQRDGIPVNLYHQT